MKDGSHHFHENCKKRKLHFNSKNFGCKFFSHWTDLYFKEQTIILVPKQFFKKGPIKDLPLWYLATKESRYL